VLDEDTSRHAVQVLRMKKGERLNLTDGKGNLMTTVILNDHKRHCSVIVEKITNEPAPEKIVAIGISLLKNTDRFEWFVEKATEIGIKQIIPLVCERTEKEKFRYERIKGICISSMLQSQQAWLPLLHEPVSFKKLVDSAHAAHKMIAHCDNTSEKTKLSSFSLHGDSIILIGPEGDFTPEEIALAQTKGFIPVSLGDTRLRTETAGIVAASLLCNSTGV
jgi:16S rRNA (uracil1498-N3)-methyltransferase